MGVSATVISALGWLFSRRGARAVTDVIGAVRPNAEAADKRAADARAAALAQLAAESRGPTWFDGLVDAMNRLPRPILALGTIGLFVFAMADPDAFTVRMGALGLVPEPLWWLLGAIVSFYFGARELHKSRSMQGAIAATRAAVELAGGEGSPRPPPEPAPPRSTAEAAAENPALKAFLERQREENRGGA